MSKHTQGPWKAIKLPDGNVEIVSGEDDSTMAIVYGDDDDPSCWPVTANANLMALAPEMEEALRAIKDHEQQPNGDACVLHIAQAILEKVDGEI